MYIASTELSSHFSPLRVVNLADQDTVEFLTEFFAGQEAGASAGGRPAPAVNPVLASAAASASATVPMQPQAFIQSIDIAAFTICIDYRPKRVDMPALFQQRDFAQLAHLFPLVDVEINMKRVKLFGIQVRVLQIKAQHIFTRDSHVQRLTLLPSFRMAQGWDSLGSEVALFWANDIARHQLHRYVAGIQPIRSISNVCRRRFHECQLQIRKPFQYTFSRLLIQPSRSATRLVLVCWISFSFLSISTNARASCGEP